KADEKENSSLGPARAGPFLFSAIAFPSRITAPRVIVVTTSDHERRARNFTSRGSAFPEQQFAFGQVRETRAAQAKMEQANWRGGGSYPKKQSRKTSPR